MRNTEQQAEPEFFDMDKPKVVYTDQNGEPQVGWHILNVSDLDSAASIYMIKMHSQRLERFDGMRLDIGTPTFHYDESEEDEWEKPEESYGLYHQIHKPEKVTWLGWAAIRGEASHLDHGTS